MKKITSVFLTTLILIMSVFSLNAFAQEQTKAEKWNKNNTNPEYEISCCVKNFETTNNATVFVKGNRIAAITELPLFESKNIKIKIIITDNDVYMYIPSFPFFYIKFDKDNTDILPSENEFVSIEDLTFIKSYEMTEETTTYYIEEFRSDGGEILKYYFIDDNLIKIESISEDEYSCIKFVSNEVDDSVFKVPWYSIDISYLFGF